MAAKRMLKTTAREGYADPGQAGPSRRLWMPSRLQQLANSVADRLMGIESAGGVSLEALGLETSQGTDYLVTSWFKLLRVRRILDDLDISTGDVFLDLGAGKGRMLWLAARYPFGRVIGVELAAELAETARRNLARHQRRLACRDIRVEVSDAAEYGLPDDVSVVYLNHPFTGATFERVAGNLCASVARNPRVLVLIYNHPVMGGYLTEQRFRVVRRDGNLITYVVPPGAGPR